MLRLDKGGFSRAPQWQWRQPSPWQARVGGQMGWCGFFFLGGGGAAGLNPLRARACVCDRHVTCCVQGPRSEKSTPAGQRRAGPCIHANLCQCSTQLRCQAASLRSHVGHLAATAGDAAASHSPAGRSAGAISANNTAGCRAASVGCLNRRPRRPSPSRATSSLQGLQ